MSWQIRPLNPTQTEYEATVALRNTVDPESPSSVAIWQHWDATRPPESKFERLVVADEDGRIVAYAQLDETHPRSGKFEFNFNGLPSIWQNGMADDLLDVILQRIQQHQPKAATSQIRESEEDKSQLLQAQGFKPIMRYPISHLAVQQFDPALFADKLVYTAQQGIEIRQPPVGWHEQQYWQQLIHEIDWQLMQDVPHHEERVKTPLPQFVDEEFNHPNFLPSGYFIAFDGETAVGMTNFVKRGGETERLATAVTGVLRSHRRKGIATALKVASIAHAQTLETKIIITNNEENNPMYLINVQLGFEAQPAWVDWEKEL